MMAAPGKIKRFSKLVLEHPEYGVGRVIDTAEKGDRFHHMVRWQRDGSVSWLTLIEPDNERSDDCGHEGS